MMADDEKYPTGYGKKDSLSLLPLPTPTITIKGTPRSGRVASDKKLNKEEKKQKQENLNNWEKDIKNAIHEQIYKKEHPIKDFLPFESECILYVTFFLSNAETVYGKPRYSSLDLDNLLKPLQDTLQDKRQKSKIIADDSLFKGIKVRKELVANANEERAEFSIIPTKIFTIDSVNKGIKGKGIEGNAFIEYWESKMQYITATDENGHKGTFIDHLPKVFLRDEHEIEQYYRDLVPGYDWEKQIGKKVSGCMVVMRRHHLKIEDHKEDHKKKSGKRDSWKELLWLHKWDW